ncbi:MAG TPA: MerR family transcriptional regulator [Solirubrobacteraceae bacterium]|jgi:DNA-binding transcriptional MerR regulator
MSNPTPAKDAPRSRNGEANLRIGDVAKLVGTTPRTIRYYEEIGLLPESPERAAGRHRLYSEAEVERLMDVMRLKQLLGVSLEELKTLLAAEEARNVVKAQLKRGDVDPGRRQALLEEALGHIERQLELVRGRAAELAKLEQDLSESRTRVRRKLREMTSELEPEPVGQAS